MSGTDYNVYVRSATRSRRWARWRRARTPPAPHSVLETQLATCGRRPGPHPSGLGFRDEGGPRTRCARRTSRWSCGQRGVGALQRRLRLLQAEPESEAMEAMHKACRAGSGAATGAPDPTSRCSTAIRSSSRSSRKRALEAEMGRSPWWAGPFRTTRSCASWAPAVWASSTRRRTPSSVVTWQ